MIYERLEVRKILLLSAVVGIVAGIFVILFSKALELSTHLFLTELVGYTPPKPLGEGGTTNYTFLMERKFLLPFVTALGGLLTGILVYLFSPESAGVGTDAAVKAFHHNLPVGFKTAVMKLLTSAITIGSGGVSGREGPMALIGASVGKGIASKLKLSSREQNILLAAGLGAGIGAMFRSPFAGGILSAEVFYKEDFEIEALIPGFVASIVAYIVAGSVIGFDPLFYTEVPFPHFSEETIAGFAILGIASAVVAKILVKTFFTVRKLFKRLKVHFVLKPAIGGFLVGLCGLITPLAIGNSYGWIQMFMSNQPHPFSVGELILSIFVVILALSLTLGSGGSGGVFGPSLVVGGITGAALSEVLNTILHEPAFNTGVMTIVGMISVFTAVASAPLSTIVLVAEMTQGYNILPLALISLLLAQAIAGNEETIFESQVKKRTDSPLHKDELKAYILETAKVREVMTKSVITLSPEDTALKAKEIMAEKFIAGIPITVNGRVVGIVTTSDVLKVEPEKLKEVKLREIMTPNPECVLPDWTLLKVMKMLTSKGFGRAPVVNDFETMKLVGIISRSDIGKFLIKKGIR